MWDSPATFPGEATMQQTIMRLESRPDKNDPGSDGCRNLRGMIELSPLRLACSPVLTGWTDSAKLWKAPLHTPSEVQYSEGDTAKAQELGTNMINNGAAALSSE